ncbi:MAG: hypothetical protein Kilf2KO_09100 [Rhodospirillales bacterium]
MKRRIVRIKRPRNPVAPQLRKLGAKTEPSSKTYRRKPKHPKPIRDDESERS